MRRLTEGDPSARLVLTDEPYNVPMTGGRHREFAMASRRRAEAKLTIQQLIETHLNRPDVAERLAAIRAMWDPVLDLVRQLHARLVDMGRALEESPASPGYEPYLVQQLRADPLVARGMAKLFVRHVLRWAEFC